MRAQPPAIDDPERQVTLIKADQATGVGAIERPCSVHWLEVTSNRVEDPTEVGADCSRRDRDLGFGAARPHFPRTSMQSLRFPSAAVPAGLPAPIRLPVVSPAARPPEGEGWLHEIKHDGHRLAAILDGRGGLRLISRRGYDRTPLFRAPFRELLAFGREIVLDGEIAVPDDRGVTHIGDLQDAIEQRRPERLAYFAFDLLHLDGHDLRGCQIEDRQELLRSVNSTMRAVLASSTSTT